MLGNGPDPTCTTYPDGVGDCTFAGRQHYKMAKAADYGETETWETSDALVAEYLAYDDGQDNGAVIADLLLAWYKAGKILAFAPVDHTDPAAVDSAMQAFRGVYSASTSPTTPTSCSARASRGPSPTASSPTPMTGTASSRSRLTASELDGYVTWGALQPATREWRRPAWRKHGWSVTTEDEAAKIDMAALLADINALGGTGGNPAPVTPPRPSRCPCRPAPEPPPAPVNPQTLLEELAAHVRGVAASAEKDITELLAFLASHGL